MRNKNTKLFGGIVIAVALVAAFFTKPTRANHERYVADTLSDTRERALRKGELLSWFVGKGVDMARGGRYESGIFTSTYYVTLAGIEIWKCTGIYGNISCFEIESK